MNDTRDALPIQCNVRLRQYEDDKLVDERTVHNVLTDTGRAWTLRRLCASSFVPVPPTPLDTALPQYMGFGVGGILQTDTRFDRTQVELSTVTALEDPVVFSTGPDVYLKAVEGSSETDRHFPTAYTHRYICKILETEIAFAGATSGKGVVMNTAVDLSECGLYLSTANVAAAVGDANGLIAYAAFSPWPVRPGRVIEVIWEFRI